MVHHEWLSMPQSFGLYKNRIPENLIAPHIPIGNPHVTVIDVRSHNEYSNYHIRGSFNVNIDRMHKIMSEGSTRDKIINSRDYLSRDSRD